ncbi:MAG: hypothetical protein ACJ72A_25280 [Nocardioidaceae bacterium]
MRRSTYATFVAAALAATTLLSVQSAEAEGLGGSGGVRYTRSTVTIPASTGEPTSARAVATCPKGWWAVGGGQSISGGAGRGIAAGMQLTNRKWYAEAWQANHAATSLTTYAVCVQRPGWIYEEDQTEYYAPPGPQSLDQSGSCPGGHVVSGGVTYWGSTTAEFTLNSSYPVDDSSDPDSIPDNGWRGRVTYTGDSEPVASVYLWCLTGQHPAYRKASVTVPAGESARTRALCPLGRPVLGGGVRATGPGDASHAINSRPIDTRDAGTVPDDGWRGAVTNTSDQDLTMTVYAVCR